MVFEELVLHNFGVYRGQQAIDLLPPSKRKPVVLVGALNGGGKTTLLDALNLALYGKQARCSNRQGLAYDEFLRRSIHRGVDPEEGAAVELAFRRWESGEEHRYRVHRSWRATNRSVREKVEVWKDDSLDSLLTEAWSEQVESFLPLGMSNLFLFDGEKIEQLADIENSTALLSTAIQSLLGLNLVERLETDLQVLERRKRATLQTREDREATEAAQSALDQARLRHRELMAERARVQTALDRKEKALARVQQHLKSEGGDLYEGRRDIEAQRTAAQTRLLEYETQLRELAAGPAPLLLVEDLLQTVALQNEAEERARESALVRDLLLERDGQLLARLQELKTPKRTVAQVSVVLEEDRARRAPTSEPESLLNLSSAGRQSLQVFLSASAGEIRVRASSLLDSVEKAQLRLADLDRKLEAVPDKDSVAQLFREREEAIVAVETARVRLGALDQELEQSQRDVERREESLRRLLERDVEVEFTQAELDRSIRASAKVRSTLQRFRREMVARHTSRIETLVLDSFKNLLRKGRLVKGVQIDPDTLRVTLLGRGGEQLPPERLSAGERQLLAVSLLWGLARASGRDVPTVVDTPLGRLDSEHRSHLVDRYFPKASHQVLLLSTDKEIDADYFQRLKPSVGRAYTLEFDDDSGSTRVRQGYFW